MIKAELNGKLEEAISKAQIKKAIELFKVYVKGESPHREVVIMLSSSFEYLHAQKIAGTLKEEDYMRGINQINQRMFQLSELLQEADLIRPEIDPSGKYTPQNLKILLICQEGDEDHLTKFWRNFHMAPHIQKSGPYVDPDGFNLIIFDNHKLPPLDSYRSFLDARDDEELSESDLQHIEYVHEYLKHSPIFMIHYGEQLYLLQKYREKVHAANSQFSLYARIREMAQYMNDFEDRVGG